MDKGGEQRLRPQFSLPVGGENFNLTYARTGQGWTLADLNIGSLDINVHLGNMLQFLS